MHMVVLYAHGCVVCTWLCCMHMVVLYAHGCVVCTWLCCMHMVVCLFPECGTFFVVVFSHKYFEVFAVRLPSLPSTKNCFVQTPGSVVEDTQIFKSVNVLRLNPRNLSDITIRNIPMKKKMVW